MKDQYATKWADPGQMKYRELMAEDLPRLAAYYRLRPNRSCDSSPLVSYLYKHYYMVEYCEVGDSLHMSYHVPGGPRFGFLPYCREAELEYYFRLQESYFNHVLGRPFNITSADEEGVKVLLDAGALENYEIIPEEDLRDYLYRGDDLRTLAGRKYAKKRNHINRFLSEYAGRWLYRALDYTDRDAVRAFLDEWMRQKRLEDQGAGVSEEGRQFDPAVELDGEYLGIMSLIGNRSVYSFMRIGGIFIDGRLSAFSIGVNSESCSMAIIDVEKAFSDIPGLYQMINREFLVHEFPDAELVNREDDVGIVGLRQSKLSYYPCGFEMKYTLRQKQ